MQLHCLLLISAFVGLAALFFAIGFVVDYFQWVPQLEDSRLRQAAETGVFFAVGSMILEPILYLTWMAHLTKDVQAEPPNS